MNYQIQGLSIHAEVHGTAEPASHLRLGVRILSPMVIKLPDPV